MPIIIAILAFAAQFLVKEYYGSFISLFGMVFLCAVIHYAKPDVRFNKLSFILAPFFVLAVDASNYLISGNYFPTIGLFVAAFIEEVVYRFYLDDELSKHHSSGCSGMISLGVFLLIHVPKYLDRLQSYIILGFATTFFLYYKRKTRDLMLVSLLHFGFNSFLMLFLLPIVEYILYGL